MKYGVMLLTFASLMVNGCQQQEAPIEVHATIPHLPSNTPILVAPIIPPKGVIPPTPKGKVDNALWHFRYARGILEKKH